MKARQHRKHKQNYFAHERWPYHDIVFDESTEFISLSQHRTTQFLKSLITKDYA